MNKGVLLLLQHPPKISLHSNFGAYFIIVSSVTLVVKCHFMLSYMFQVFLSVLKFHCIEYNIFGVFHGCNIFIVVKQHFLVIDAHTSPFVLGECMQSGILM